MMALGLTSADILTDAAIRNAMVVHAAFGGSTNLLLHIPAIAHAAGRARPTISDWMAINRSVPRLVDCLPNGPHPTVRVYLAGGVPEVMLHLRRLGLLDTSVMTVTGERLDVVLDWWEGSDRRRALRDRLRAVDGIDPDDVVMGPERARARGLTSTVTFVRGNLAPDGAIVKSTAIAPSLLDADGVYRLTGPARVFTSERAAVAAVKSQGPDRIKGGEVMVLACRGPMGAGMEETYQVTSALKYLAADEVGGAPHRRALLGRLDGAVHRPHRPRGARRRPHRAPPRRRPHPRRHRPQHARGDDRPRGARAGRRGRARRRGTRRPPAARRPRGRPGAAGRHAAVGGAAAGQRRHVGRVRLRRGRPTGSYTHTSAVSAGTDGDSAGTRGGALL
jgi:hypothetical protein